MVVRCTVVLVLTICLAVLDLPVWSQVPRVVSTQRKKDINKIAVPKVLSTTKPIQKDLSVPVTINTFRHPDSTPTIGIGFFTDTSSNISYQYSVYNLLYVNKIKVADKRYLMPVLTLRRGMSEYYLNGIINYNKVLCSIWKSGKLLNKFTVVRTADESFDDILPQLYVLLVQAVTGKEPSGRINTRFTKTELPHMGSVSDKIGDHVLMSAINITPELDEYDNIIKHYIHSYKDISNEAEISVSDFTSKKQVNTNNERNARYKSIYDANIADCMAILPARSLLNENLSTIQLAQSVATIYTENEVQCSFFDNKFIDSKAKRTARKVIGPAYKRPGSVLTYLQCAEQLTKGGYSDQAIQVYISALIMVDNLLTGPTFKEFLKSRIYLGLAEVYKNNKQNASAYIARYFSELHRGLSQSKLLEVRDRDLKKTTVEVKEYLNNIESDALQARSKARTATWTGIMSAAVTIGSAYNDASNGLSSPSKATEDMLNTTVESFERASELKEASLEETAEASAIFNESFRELLQQINADNNNLSAYKPVFAVDLTRTLADFKLANENKNVFYDLADALPLIKLPIQKYFDGLGEKQHLPILLKTIYKTLVDAELRIYSSEASGIETREDLIKKI